MDEKRCTTLKELSHRMKSFNYGYMHSKDKPTPIARETMNALEDATLKQSGLFLCLIIFHVLFQYTREALINTVSQYTTY